MNDVHEFAAGAQGVLARFMEKNCVKIPGGRDACFNGVKLLEATPISEMKKTHRVEAIGNGIYEFRCRNLPGHWIRFLLGFHPTGKDIVILLVVTKKTNRISPADIKQAAKNLRLYITR